MRFRIELESVQDQILPWDYQYAVRAAIYRYLQQADPGFATFLHQDGYEAAHHRRYKLFVFSDFSPLLPRQRTEVGYVLRRRQRLRFCLSSPLEERFLAPLVTGVFKKDSVLALAVPYATVAKFRILQIQVQPPEDFSTGKVTAILLSPVVVSLQRPDGSTEYLRALDPRVPEQLRKNLLQKYQVVYGAVAPGLDITIRVDRDYVERKGGDTAPAITVLRRVFKRDHRQEGRWHPIAVRGFRAPLHLEGSPELIQIAYDCGIGEKNAAGFGCWTPWSGNRRRWKEDTGSGSNQRAR